MTLFRLRWIGSLETANPFSVENVIGWWKRRGTNELHALVSAGHESDVSGIVQSAFGRVEAFIKLAPVTPAFDRNNAATIGGAA